MQREAAATAASDERDYEENSEEGEATGGEGTGEERSTEGDGRVAAAAMALKRSLAAMEIMQGELAAPRDGDDTTGGEFCDGSGDQGGNVDGDNKAKEAKVPSGKKKAARVRESEKERIRRGVGQWQ